MISWKHAFQRPDVRKLWTYSALVVVGGFTLKQVIWALTHDFVKEKRELAHLEASANLEQAYADGRRLAAMKRTQELAASQR